MALMSAMFQPPPMVTAQPPSLPSSNPQILGAASNYQYPLTSGLMSSLLQPNMTEGSQAAAPPPAALAPPGAASAVGARPPPPALPPGTTDYTAQALGLAGWPRGGPLAPVPVPSGAAAPGGIPSASGGSSGSALGSTALGLLGTLAKNPSLVKNGVSAVQGLLGGGGAAASIPALTASDIAASDAAGGGLMGDVGAIGYEGAGGALPGAAGAGGATAYGADLGAETAADGVYGAADAGAADAGAGAASGAGGVGSALAAAGPGALFLGGLLGMKSIFDNQSANPETYATDANRASATLASQAAQQSNPTYAAALNNASNLWKQQAQYALSGQLNKLLVAQPSTSLTSAPFRQKV